MFTYFLLKPITEKLVKMVMNDLPKVIIDYNLTKKKKKGIYFKKGYLSSKKVLAYG